VKPTRRVADEAVDEALEAVGLTEYSDEFPPTLSHGQRKLVGVARALASRPRCVLLDEPAAGLDSGESVAFGSELRQLVDKHGVGVLLVDHDMGLVLNVCDYIYVLNFGQLIAEGTAAEIRENPEVVAAYLGEQEQAAEAAAREALEAASVGSPRPMVTVSESYGNAVSVTDGHRGPDHEVDSGADSDLVLNVKDLTTGYNGVPAVRDLNLTIGQGEVVALFGPNGAGKTTTLLTISGLVSPMEGSILLNGEETVGVPAHLIARRGLAHVAEDRAIMPSLTVRENLRLVRVTNGADTLEKAVTYFPVLGDFLDRRAATLSGGEQQMLAIALALAGNPKLLMVDEMSLGLAPVIVQRLLPVVRDIANETGTAVLLVEQHVHLALDVSDRAYILSHGDLVLEGRSEELSKNRELLESSYLGARAL
jgi:branched-chain amino acid transport system ATP-binding protein